MTAVSPSHRSVSPAFDWSAFASPIVVLNLVLIGLVGVGFTYYIVGANAVASGEYNISTKRIEITKLIETQSLLTAKKSATENPVAALVFAQVQHMTEAKDVVYVFENNNVALQR